MFFTTSYLRRSSRLKFINIKPTFFFIQHYTKLYTTIPVLSGQAIPKIKRSLLIKFL